MGTSTTTGTTYMAVETGGTEQATWSTPQTSLKIYWGSIDADIVDGISNQFRSRLMATHSLVVI